jgi:hypothetical protein
VVCDGERAHHHRACSDTEDLMKLMELDEELSIPTRWAPDDALGRIAGLDSRVSRASWLRRSVVGVWEVQYQVVSVSEADIYMEITRMTAFVNSSRVRIWVPARLEVIGDGCTLTGSLHAENPEGVFTTTILGAFSVIVAVLGVAISLGGAPEQGLVCLLFAAGFMCVAVALAVFLPLELRSFVRSSMTMLRSRLDVRCV